MFSFSLQDILGYFALFCCILVVLPVHEFAHAFAAVKNGDDTPRFSGRYTLNPLRHFDIPGLLMLLIAHFGWAKPVPVNPNNFRNYKAGMFWVSIAGVLSNLLMAFIAYPLLILSFRLPDILLFDDFITYFFYYAVYLNLSLFVFNLLPIFPLDGFRVVETFSRRRNKYMEFMYQYGMYVLIGLCAISFMADYVPALTYIDVLGNYLQRAVSVLAWPITQFWGLII